MMHLPASRQAPSLTLFPLEQINFGTRSRSKRTENWPQQASKTKKGGLEKNLTTGIQILLPPDPESPPFPCNRSEQWVNISKYGDQNSKGCQKKNHPSLPGFGTGMTCPSGAWAEHIAVTDLHTAWTLGHTSLSWPTHFGDSWLNLHLWHYISVPSQRCIGRWNGGSYSSCHSSTPTANLPLIPWLTSRKLS